MYTLMAGYKYYPSGPNDVLDEFECLEEANKAGIKALEHLDWFAIFEDSKLIGSQGEWYGQNNDSGVYCRECGGEMSWEHYGWDHECY